MRSKATLTSLALAVLFVPAAVGQHTCSPGVTATVTPAVAGPGELVQVTLTNNSSTVIDLPSSCLFGQVISGGNCSGPAVLGLLCLAVITPIAPGQSLTQTWDQRDNSGTQVPDGTYSFAIDYYDGTGLISCCPTVTIQQNAGTPFCFGDGSDGVICPCGNTPAAGSGEGCTNGSGVGAFITASGLASVAADSLVFTVSQAHPNEFGIFVQNIATSAATPFYNGAICLPGDAHLVRHYAPPIVLPTQTDATGTGTNAQPMTSGDFLADTQPGVTIYYQFWGRDTVSCGNGANFSSGLAITWQP